MSAHVEGTFDVIGAARALAYFGALDAASLSHGYLFAGAAGVGKKTFARRLAQSLFCEAPKTVLLGYDGTCRACRSFAAGSYPDYYESVGKVAIGERDAGAADAGDRAARFERYESVRDKERMESRGLVRELQLRPYAGRWRVVVLGDVDFASADAANALLKFFEEPPPFVVIVVTTDAPFALLPTIRSRLVEVAFGPLSRDQVAEILERDGVAPREARVAADASLGSVVRARAMLEGTESGTRDAAIAWLEDSLAGRVPDTAFIDGMPKAADKRKAAGEMLEFVRAFARDYAALAIGGSAAPMLATDLRERIERLPKRSPQRAADVLAAVADAQRLASTNVSPGLVLDYLRMQLTTERGA
jgi:DNA polymerase-3 subunit delta'